MSRYPYSFSKSQVKKQEAITAFCKACLNIVNNDYMEKREMEDYIEALFPREIPYGEFSTLYPTKR